MENFSSSFRKIIFASCLLFIFPFFASAASLSFSPASGSYEVGSTLTVAVSANSAGVALNALSGTIIFPSDQLEVLSLSKNQSIISLWVQEPSFSNQAGTVNFEGIVLNPGYTGSQGKVLSLTFRVKASGQANVSFSEGSILANDGEGSEILSGLGQARFSIVPVQIVDPAPVLEEPAVPGVVEVEGEVPEVISSSHPLDGWSNQKSGVFNFALPEDVVSMRLLLDDVPESIPLVVYTPPITSREIAELDEGVSYLHVQYKTSEGWGDILHYKLQIDTVLPTSLEVTESAPGAFTFTATDTDSGIAYFEVQIDGGEFSKFADDGSHIYHVPELAAGVHTLVVRAFDAAGNFISTSTTFTSTAPAEVIPPVVPVVTPEVPVATTNFLAQGSLVITILSIIIPCLALVLLLGALLYFAWQRAGGLRRRIDTEVAEAKAVVHRAFSLLHHDLAEDIEILKKANKKRKLTREESKILKRLQKNLLEAEQVISKEVADIEKENEV